MGRLQALPEEHRSVSVDCYHYTQHHFPRLRYRIEHLVVALVRGSNGRN